VLSEHQAGLYAGGLILTKAVLFLPQFVVVVAFPSLSTAAERRRALLASLAVVAILGALATAGAALLPRLALVFVGGASYEELAGHLWVFAILGTILSMLQLLVYAVLAQQGQRAVDVVWTAFALMVGVGLTTTSVRELLTVVISVDAALLVTLFLVSLRAATRPVRPPVESTV
jgi:O-antigen/teichoic acid export membrane protein